VKVDVKLDPNVSEPTAVIHAAALTPELVSAIEILEKLGTQPFFLTAKKDDKSFVLEPTQVDIIRTEGGIIKCYNQQGQDFIVTRPLNELLEQLGSNFMRISKSTIVNIYRIDHLSNSFNRTMYIIMKNGVSDYITKNYLKDIRNRLGL